MANQLTNLVIKFTYHHCTLTSNTCGLMFWECTVQFLTCTYLYMLKIGIGLTTLSYILPMSVALGFLFGIRRYEVAWLMHSGFTCLICCWAHLLLSTGGSWFLASSSGVFMYRMLAFSCL